MAKTRVHELAKTYGIESKEVLEKLKELGEFVKSPSSTIELPVEMKFKKAYGDALLAAKSPAPAAEAPAETPGPKPGPKKAPAKKAAEAPAEPEVVETPAAAVEPLSRSRPPRRRPPPTTVGPRPPPRRRARRAVPARRAPATTRSRPARAWAHAPCPRRAPTTSSTATVRRVPRPAGPGCLAPTRR